MSSEDPSLPTLVKFFDGTSNAVETSARHFAKFEIVPKPVWYDIDILDEVWSVTNNRWNRGVIE
jgi:hypothetical protein